jgi:hypothetical protein
VSRYLLDTNTALIALTDPDRLRLKLSSFLDSSDNQRPLRRDGD